MFGLQGHWEDDERNGIGELTYNTGDKYNGEWCDDKQREFDWTIHFLFHFAALIHQVFPPTGKYRKEVQLFEIEFVMSGTKIMPLVKFRKPAPKIRGNCFSETPANPRIFSCCTYFFLVIQRLFWLLLVISCSPGSKICF